MRTRRCAWNGCHAPATQRVKATYLGQPVDSDTLMCDPHIEVAPTLLREGWAIASIEPLAQEHPPMKEAP